MMEKEKEKSEGKKEKEISEWEKGGLYLKDIKFLFYGDRDSLLVESNCVFYNPDKSSELWIDKYELFLDRHFAGFLTLERKEKEIIKKKVGEEEKKIVNMYYVQKVEIGKCSSGDDYYYGNWKNILGDFFRAENKSGSKNGSKRIKENFILKIKSTEEDPDQSGFSGVIDEIEDVNRDLLKQWELNQKIVSEKLLNFINYVQESRDKKEKYREEAYQREQGVEGEQKDDREQRKKRKSDRNEIPYSVLSEILCRIKEQIINAPEEDWEASISVAITWLLLTSLLRGDINCLETYYRNMGKPHERRNLEKRKEREEKQKAEKKAAEKRVAAKAKKDAVKAEAAIKAKAESVNLEDAAEEAEEKETEMEGLDDTGFEIRRRKSLYADPGKIKPFTMSEIGNLKETYVERESLLNWLQMQFFGESQEEKRYVYISAMGGEGKSELARAYAYENRDQYDEIFWLTCGDGKLPKLGELLKENSYSITLDQLGQLDERSLIIVDNCNEMSKSCMARLHEETGWAHLLVTTRLNQIPVKKTHILSIGATHGNQQEHQSFAIDVFCANYFAEPVGLWAEWEEGGDCETSQEVKKQLSHEENNCIKTICSLVGNHPMISAMLAVNLRENRECTIQEFAARCENGLSESVPEYRRVPFGQNGEDYEETPIEILKCLFSGFLHRKFNMPERQILSILKLIPAQQLDIKYLCELLGDNRNQVAMEEACKELRRYNWIQSNGSWVALHPLISELLELNWEEFGAIPEKWISEAEELTKKTVLIRASDFYQNALKNWMVMDSNVLERNLYLVYKIWQKSGIQEENSTFNLAVCSLLQKNRAKRLFQKIFPRKKFTLVAYADYEKGRAFLYYNMINKKEEFFYSLQDRRYGDQYWECVESRKQGQKEKSMGVGAVAVTLLYMICRQKNANLDLPDSLLNCDIKKIPIAFCIDNQAITMLRLPEHLEEIEAYAFENCSNMRGILSLPKGLKQIGEGAFALCCSLSGSITIPGTVKKIGDKAFAGCGFDGELVIENGVNEIGEHAFGSCDALKRIRNLPDSIVEIGVGSFSLCGHLCGEIIFPKDIREIRAYSFFQCEYLEKVTFPKCLTKIEKWAFANCKKLSGRLDLPKSLKELGDFSFYNCCMIDEMEFPPNLKNLGKYAFANCSNMRGELDILTKYLTEVPEGTFSNCHNLVKIILADQITRIEKKAFEGCEALNDEWQLPNDLEVIGDGAFQGCKSRRGTITFPERLVKIGASAFSGCEKLSGDLMLSHVQEIGEKAFLGCKNLDGRLILSSKMKVIKKETFFDCEKLAGDLILPVALEIIEARAFYGCRELTGILKVPHNFSYLCRDSFDGCFKIDTSNLNDFILKAQYSITIAPSGELRVPEGVTDVTIGNFDVKKCSDCIKIPDCIYTIGENVFRKRKNIKRIILSSQLSVIGNGAFQGCYNLREIGVEPAGLQEKIEKSFLNLLRIDEKEKFSYPDTLIGRFIKSLKVEEYEIKKLILPNSLEKIGAFSFSGCSGLCNTLKIPDNVKEIGECAFEKCYNSLQGELKIPKGITEIRKGTFRECCISNLILNKNTKIIGKSAFYHCKELKTIDFAQGLEVIGENAFGECRSLTELIFPNSLRIIKKGAFMTCFGLIKIVLPDSLEELGDAAFYGCEMLTGEIIIPEKVRRIGGDAFDACNNLQKIIVKGAETILENSITDNRDVIICGYEDSAAEECARKNGLDFNVIS